MVYQVSVQNSDIVFECNLNQSILDAALKAGYQMPHSCRKGICGSCKGKISGGEVNADPSLEALTKDERALGYHLLCRAFPCSDVVIDVGPIKKADPDAIKTVDARLYKLEHVTEDVSVLNLRFPAGVRIPFKPGQYLQVVLSDGVKRSYSMANPGHQTDSVQLHVRHVDNGAFTSYLQTTAAVGDQLTLEMPFGDFYLRESKKPLIFLASGTGFAPIKAIIESMLKKGPLNRQVYFYWGGRRKCDLYLLDLPLKWEKLSSQFEFIPVLSEEDNGVDRTGFVHKAVLSDFESLAEYEVYACGALNMIKAAREEFLQLRHLPTNSFYCDAFVTSGP